MSVLLNIRENEESASIFGQSSTHSSSKVLEIEHKTSVYQNANKRTNMSIKGLSGQKIINWN